MASKVTDPSVHLVKSYDPEIKELVFTFMKYSERTLKLNLIPDIIFYLCLDFYFERQMFAECGAKMKVLETYHKMDTVKKFKSGDIHSAVGDVIVPSMDNKIHRWTVEIIQGGQSVIVIGIVADTFNRFEKAFYSSKDVANYGYNGYSGSKVTEHRFTNYGCTYKKGKELIVELDLSRSEGVLRYFVDGESQGTAFRVVRNQDTQYRFAVALQDIGDSVAITHYRCFHIKQ